MSKPPSYPARRPRRASQRTPPSGPGPSAPSQAARLPVPVPAPCPCPCPRAAVTRGTQGGHVSDRSAQHRTCMRRTTPAPTPAMCTYARGAPGRRGGGTYEHTLGAGGVVRAVPPMHAYSMACRHACEMPPEAPRAPLRAPTHPGLIIMVAAGPALACAPAYGSMRVRALVVLRVRDAVIV